jgi:hypothetical protein
MTSRGCCCVRHVHDSLMVLHSDNGGYTKSLGPCSAKDAVMGVTCMTGEAGASNHPLR